MPDYNVTTTPTPAANQPTHKPSSPTAPALTRTVTRTIAPPSVFDPDKGVSVPQGDWGKGRIEESAPAPEAPAEPAKADRKSEWLKAQETKRAEKKAAKDAGAAKAQERAKDLLEKGDLAGAAKALGMTPEELARQVNAAYMGLPKEPKELTAEEKRDAALASYKTELENEKTARQRLEAGIARQNYITSTIAPAIADKDKYEFIHAQGADAITSYMYDYCNEHFRKTGEELSVSDVADAIEENLVNAWKEEHERFSKTKKGQALLAPPPPHEFPATSEEIRDRPGVSVHRPRIEERSPADLGARTPLATEPGATTYKATRTNGSTDTRPFALLTPEERRRRLREEDAQQS